MYSSKPSPPANQTALAQIFPQSMNFTGDARKQEFRLRFLLPKPARSHAARNLNLLPSPILESQVPFPVELKFQAAPVHAVGDFFFLESLV